MRHALFLVVLFLAAPAFAQSAHPLNTPLTAVFTHPGTGTDGYRLYLDGTQVADLPVAALANGEVRLPIPAIPAAGTHSLEASAYNTAGETRSPALAFFVGAPPAPGPVRIETTTRTVLVFDPQPDGSVKPRLESVTSESVVR
jgi:hypothetical protein